MPKAAADLTIRHNSTNNSTDGNSRRTSSVTKSDIYSSKRESDKDESEIFSDDTDAVFLRSIISRLLEVDISTKANNEIVVSKTEIICLCQLAIKSFNCQSSFIRLGDNSLPLTICADLHGQFEDLKVIFRECGFPPGRTWLFLGDYVDRGKNGVELICLLLAFKVAYPDKCYLLRGNHEDYNTSMVYGFYDECLLKYGDGDKHLVWLSFINVFNYMPLSAIIGGRVLAMHGGISPFINTLDNLASIKRPTMIPLWGFVCDLVWSDPGATRPGWSTSLRSVSFSYDESVIDQFCNKHNIDLIVRGHQIHDSWSDRGYNMTKNCKLVTIFSAPNYLGGGSTAAVLTVSKEMECRFELFRPKKIKRAKVKPKKHNENENFLMKL